MNELLIMGAIFGVLALLCAAEWILGAVPRMLFWLEDLSTDYYMAKLRRERRRRSR